MKFILTVILLLDILAIYRVINDNTYLIGNDKYRYIFWIVMIPVIGSIVAMYKIGYLRFFQKHMGRAPMTYPDKKDAENADKTEFSDSVTDVSC